MRVFISWSGDLSRQLGETFRNWLPSALQFVKPYFSPNDIDKGAKWVSEVSKELAASSICIIILTRENLNSNWIMFESGAISTALDNARVCPVIFDLDPTDLQGPLAQFQVTRFIKEDIRKLFKSINSLATEQKLEDAVIESVFEKWWPDLERDLRTILASHVANGPSKTIRSDRDLIEEILLLLRNQPGGKDSRPSYTGSVVAHLIGVLKWVIDEDGMIVFAKLHKELLSVRAVSEKVLADGETKKLLFQDLDELISRTRPSPPRRVKRQSGLDEMDDEIPF